MYRVIACLTQEHTHWLVGVAAFVCAVGACLTVLLNRRLLKTTGRRQKIQLALVGVMSGTTIWSTHFIAMLAYDPGVAHGYQASATIGSLAVAAMGMLGANTLLTYNRSKYTHLISGGIFGLTVSAMHFMGMSAYLLPGTLSWDPTMVVASVVLGVGLGAATHHRILYPTTRYCWLGGSALMVLAICSMHFTGMAAFEIALDGTIEPPAQVISDLMLVALIVAVTGLIYLLGFASLTIEVDVQRQANFKLRHAALHDVLTGLPNRVAFEKKRDALQQRINRDRLEKVAVLNIDLNFFREINERHGHAGGDIALQTIANRLRDAQQEHEFFARVDGDEFVALKRGFQRKDEIRAFAGRVMATITAAIDIDGVEVSVEASIGTANSVTDGRNVQDLLDNAALALKRAKAETDNPICAFDTDLDARSRDRILLAADLRVALTQKEFELAYQFQNNIASQDIVGFEALLRWKHPTRGYISPDEFIPIAEETGQIRKIGLWVLETACAEAMTWDQPYSIAVNVAPQQLAQASFIEHVTDILMMTGLAPNRLELEITEASIIDDQAFTIEAMHRLQKMGMRIAMDDFGTGYSSLATLQAFPFDKIKIDKSFVRNLHNDAKRAAIVKATLLLAEAFNIPVLAEGVEDIDELTFLRDLNCGTAQGYYFGKPMFVHDLKTALSKTSANQIPRAS